MHKEVRKSSLKVVRSRTRVYSIVKTAVATMMVSNIREEGPAIGDAPAVKASAVNTDWKPRFELL